MQSDWNPPIACSALEERILKLCKKQKLWNFLRKNRHLLIDDETRETLRNMYATGSGRAGNPVAPERLALAMLLQVAFQVADHEVPTLTAVDRRWQMVLDCIGREEPAFSQATVFSFRERARSHGFMDYFLDRTVMLAREQGGFSAKHLRTLLDSSPLTGAGRVEDTYNLLGRAIAKLANVAAVEAGCDADALADELELSVLTGSSVKAALDVDWRLPEARKVALKELLDQFERLLVWLKREFSPERLNTSPLKDAIGLCERIINQDTEPDPDPPTETCSENDSAPSARPARAIRRGTALDRQVSISDPDMRHGRKSKTKVFNGYKRHIAADADIPGLILDVELLPANQKEHDAAQPLISRLQSRGFGVEELHIDRGYLAAEIVHELRSHGVRVVTKPPTPARTKRYNKYDFIFDEQAQTLTCPEKTTIPYRGDGWEHRFPTKTCRICPSRKNCVAPSNKYGKKIQAHPHETFFREMAAELATSLGRALRRERIPVEHALAKISQIQTNRARFFGLEKNQFDLKRAAVVANLYALERLGAAAA